MGYDSLRLGILGLFKSLSSPRLEFKHCAPQIHHNWYINDPRVWKWVWLQLPVNAQNIMEVSTRGKNKYVVICDRFTSAASFLEGALKYYIIFVNLWSGGTHVRWFR